MRRFIGVLAAMVLAASAGIAKPQASADALVREGVAAFDRGDYESAIRAYLRALEAEPANVVASVELAMAYSATGQPQRCSEVIAPHLATSSAVLGPHIANVAATCAEATGDAKRALKIYKKAIRRFPNEAFLWFNQAVSLVAVGHRDDALKSAERAVRLQPATASAWLLISELHTTAGHKLPALLATLRFLALEPASKRSPTAAQRVVDVIGAAARSDDGKNVTITLDVGGKGSEFSDFEFMLGMLSAQRFLEENAGKPEEVLRAEAVATLLAYLEERKPEKREKGLTAEFVLPFLAGLHRDGLGPVFARDALSSLEKDGAAAWRAEHAEEVDRLRAWVEAHGGRSPKVVSLTPGG